MARWLIEKKSLVDNVTMFRKSCSSHLKTIFRYCKSLFSPFILFGAYPSPLVCNRQAVLHCKVETDNSGIFLHVVATDNFSLLVLPD